MDELLAKIDWAEILKDAGILALKLIFILIAFMIVKAIGNRIIQSTFEKIQNRRDMSPGRVITLKSIMKSVFSYILIFILVVAVMGTFQLDVTGLLAGAGIIGLAIGFGAQGLVSDVVTGFFILLEKQLDVGDYVTTAGFDGIVEETGLRTTHIRGFDGTLHYVPNREISAISNHTRGNMRALVDISISYNDNIDTAIGVLQEACDRIAETNENIVEGPNVLGVQSLGASDVVLRVIAKTKNDMQWGVERELRKALKESLEANGIEIPFPHQVYIHKDENQ
ncbi:mechanosensitive ion channel family protein [Pseudalkalibacillus salsuginis]|uniref:mechanosensitive ion channel family protein n=1 Tax=Pseudalkalibacillus salsuginis TaxID=2910972 RepID=UPI001F463D67|nr:mechanosensitive ion channel family protein [Pseudalkalibacillus salsuginis]MCF6409124.1 mechanosensitive ion channel family protein [Pseudalkalibacillus salsuginis]